MPALFVIIFPELSRVSSRKEEKKVRKREKGVRQEKEKKMEERRRKEEGGKGRKEEREEVRGKEGVRAGGEEDGRKKQGFFTFHSHSVQFSSVTQSCPTLCNIMDCSMPGFPVRHQLSQPTQTHACPLSR